MLQPPHRQSHSYTQTLNAPPERVFPLLCPVREIDWVDGWQPTLVISHSGVAEPDCIFTIADGDREAIWMVLEHDPAALRVAFIKTTPGFTVGRIAIRLEAHREGTRAHVTYAYTALSAEGARFVDSFTEGYYRKFMTDWEQALNHFLDTGNKLSG